MGQPNKLIKVVYRSLLKACNNGAKPEVFGEYGSAALLRYWKDNKTTFGGSNDQISFPSTTDQVRRIIRHEFREESFQKSIDKKRLRQDDPIAALRYVNELSYILFPPESDLSRAGIPIFDYSSSASFTGETLHFNFFEPRYLKLVQEAMAGNGWFILRAQQILDTDDQDDQLSGSILMKITEHNTMQRNVFVQCVAGPRVRVLQQEEVPIQNESVTAAPKEYVPPPMIRATHLVFHRDHEDPNALDLMQSIRAKCLDALLAVTPLKIVLSQGLPPLDPENFSFWVLRFLLEDTYAKHEWLTRQCSTSQRLLFALGLLNTNNLQQQ